MLAKQPLLHIHQLAHLGLWFEEKSKNLGPPGQESATKGVQKILDFRLSFPSWSFLQHVVNADEWGKFDLYVLLQV